MSDLYRITHRDSKHVCLERVEPCEHGLYDGHFWAPVDDFRGWRIAHSPERGKAKFCKGAALGGNDE